MPGRDEGKGKSGSGKTPAGQGISESMRASVCLEPKLEQSDRSQRAHGKAEELERDSAGGRRPREVLKQGKAGLGRSGGWRGGRV